MPEANHDGQKCGTAASESPSRTSESQEAQRQHCRAYSTSTHLRRNGVAPVARGYNSPWHCDPAPLTHAQWRHTTRGVARYDREENGNGNYAATAVVETTLLPACYREENGEPEPGFTFGEPETLLEDTLSTLRGGKDLEI